MDDLMWLKMSLFCNRSIAHHILKESVQPFITQCRANHCLKGWFIEFNTTSGENIRLALLVPGQKAEIASLDAKKYFTYFFKHLDFPSKNKLTFPLNGLFLPFPENSIQFGLYNVPDERNEVDVDRAQKVSHILIEALAENEIDEETVVTLCLYLHLTLKKQVINSCPKNELPLKALYETTEADFTRSSGLPFFGKNLEDNQTVIREITDDIYNPEFSKEQTWIVHWENVCTEAINNDDWLTSIQRLISLLDKQLDVSFAQLQLVRYLVLSTWKP